MLILYILTLKQRIYIKIRNYTKFNFTFFYLDLVFFLLF